MLIAFWIVAALLALFYVYSGGAKVVRSREKLQPMMHWVDSTPLPIVRVIGLLEVLGAIGLILPALTGILPSLTVVAALGLVAVQVGAIILHVVRGEVRQLGLNVVLLILAGVVAWLATVWN